MQLLIELHTMNNLIDSGQFKYSLNVAQLNLQIVKQFLIRFYFHVQGEIQTALQLTFKSEVQRYFILKLFYFYVYDRKLKRT